MVWKKGITHKKGGTHKSVGEKRTKGRRVGKHTKRGLATSTQNGGWETNKEGGWEPYTQKGKAKTHKRVWEKHTKGEKHIIKGGTPTRRVVIENTHDSNRNWNLSAHRHTSRGSQLLPPTIYHSTSSTMIVHCRISPEFSQLPWIVFELFGLLVFDVASPLAHQQFCL